MPYEIIKDPNGQERIIKTSFIDSLFSSPKSPPPPTSNQFQQSANHALPENFHTLPRHERKELLKAREQEMKAAYHWNRAIEEREKAVFRDRIWREKVARDMELAQLKWV
jgi:hypothetical protein